MKRKLTVLVLAAVFALATVIPVAADGPGDRTADVVVFVTSQALYYDSIITAELPMRGRFQKLEVVDGRLQTEFGPGDPGYIGGRWWMDLNGNNVMDEGDRFFSCPLLGPGRTSP
jgi:hypothetical protein